MLLSCSGCPEFHSKSTVCNKNFHLTSSYFNLISVHMKPEITAVIKLMAHSCVVNVKIVKIVWPYECWIHVWNGTLLSFEKLPNTETLEETKG